MTLLYESNPWPGSTASVTIKPDSARSAIGQLRQLIEERQWVKGAVNYDEDLHFSTYYLRASCARQTAGLYSGYSTVLAFYDGFTEHYYLLKQECLETARSVVQKALRQPRWLPQVVRRIIRLSNGLTHVFDPRTSVAELARLSDEELLGLYLRHDVSQRSLNRYARLPEALDRGVNYFSNYLLEHLRTHGLSHAAADEAFSVLSQPKSPSVLAQELLEFEQLVSSARAAGADRSAKSAPSARLRMLLDPLLVKRVRTHHKKWRFLTYHGYGRREPATLGQYFDRLAESLNRPADAANLAGLGTYADSTRARNDLLAELNLDAAHRSLFRIYPRIGAAKLHRRNAQLRNFYYLDLLLAEIASRIGVNEWTIRCMTPEEVTTSLRFRRLSSPTIAARVEGCLFAIVDNTETIVSGSAYHELQRTVQSHLIPAKQSSELRGHVACRGIARGHCRVVIRADDLREEFEPGSILVSESTDPDLIGILKNAGGVLTEQGGVTSHAAIICRELGIPAIIGIEGLLDQLHNGDLVELDAERGIVTKLIQELVSPSYSIANSAGVRPWEKVGGKAHNLDRVRAFGFLVPEFVLLDYDGFHGANQRVSSADQMHLVDWTIRLLELPPNEKVAVRSSAISEDCDLHSSAGEYRSLLNVEVKKIFPALCEFLASNEQGTRKEPYRGSIIVQRMINPDYSGVCLTLDPRTGNRNAVILEFVTGGNEDVTGGRVQPERVVIDRLTGDILEDQRRQSDRVATIDFAVLLERFLTLEARFGKPIDIEWACVNQKVYILQARAIVRAPDTFVSRCE